MKLDTLACMESEGEQDTVLDMYQHSVNEDQEVDTELILCLVKHIHQINDPGIYPKLIISIFSFYSKILDEAEFMERASKKNVFIFF